MSGLQITCHHYEDAACGAPASMMVASEEDDYYYCEAFCAKHAPEIAKSCQRNIERGLSALITLHPDDQGG